MPRSRSMSIESRYCSRIVAGVDGAAAARAAGPTASSCRGRCGRRCRGCGCCVEVHGGVGHGIGSTGRDLRERQPLPSPSPPSPTKDLHAVANIKSQIKRNKQNAARHERNKAVRSELQDPGEERRRRRRGRRRRRSPLAPRSPRSASTRPPPRASSTATPPPAATAAWPSASTPLRRADLRPSRRGEVRQPGDEHLEHELVGPVLVPAEVDVGLGDQTDRLRHLVAARVAGPGPAPSWPGRSSPCIPSSAAASLSVRASAPSRASSRWTWLCSDASTTIGWRSPPPRRRCSRSTAPGMSPRSMASVSSHGATAAGFAQVGLDVVGVEPRAGAVGGERAWRAPRRRGRGPGRRSRRRDRRRPGRGADPTSLMRSASQARRSCGRPPGWHR